MEGSLRYTNFAMTNETDENGELLPEEKRATKFGKLIRRLSLDELPELFCIFTGKMSIIGPRPLLTRYLPLYTERHRMRHEVRPGLACVSLKPMKTWSWNDQFVADVKMIFAVAREAVAGAQYRVTGDRQEFNGSNLYFDAKANEKAGEHICG